MTVAVVGGGVAGLVVARDLAAAGRDVVLLEGGERLGGSVASHEVAGLVLDSGAESFATRTTAVADLLADLGLADDIVTPSPAGAWLQLPDRAVRLPATGVLGIPGRAWAPDVRDVVGPLGAARAALDRLLPGAWGTTPGASLGALVRTRMGRRVHDRLVAPVVRGVHSADPDDLDADLAGLRVDTRRRGSLAAAAAAARAAAPAGSAVAGIRGGMHRMVSALVDDAVLHGADLRTGTPVHGLARDADGWLLGVGALGSPPEAPRTAVRADAVVLAVPGTVLGRLLVDALPEALPGPAPRPRPRVVLATLVVDAPALDAAPRGTGVLVADGAPAAGPVSARALTHGTAKWAWLAEAAGPGRHVVRLSYGPAAAIGGLPMSAVPMAQLTERAREDAAKLLRVPLPRDAVLGSARTVWPGGMPPAGAVQRQWQALVAEALAAVGGLRVAGAWTAGTGLASVVAHARGVAAELASPSA
ncbi:protoporphyrinogen/coproporphyrinogen oxidase [Actinotalea fermentans]|uniref:Protoporphyrinogen oxidase n=1 Tax=Actinotalea fermentans TaxID=43671 RepID=A0A511Z298_9CELL|nr:FAD-dependent oxidoreductase [Actinotalea fermentans]GEN81578.1 protoporphyrinogen oxidase [Actinotalea fermentans]